MESKSIREIAESLGCSKDMVYRALQEYKIELRPGYNRSQLRKYKLSDLEKGINEKGIRGCAKELGVHENILLDPELLLGVEHFSVGIDDKG